MSDPRQIPSVSANNSLSPSFAASSSSIFDSDEEEYDEARHRAKQVDLLQSSFNDPDPTQNTTPDAGDVTMEGESSKKAEADTEALSPAAAPPRTPTRQNQHHYLSSGLHSYPFSAPPTVDTSLPALQASFRLLKEIVDRGIHAVDLQAAVISNEANAPTRTPDRHGRSRSPSYSRPKGPFADKPTHAAAVTKIKGELNIANNTIETLRGELEKKAQTERFLRDKNYALSQQLEAEKNAHLATIADLRTSKSRFKAVLDTPPVGFTDRVSRYVNALAMNFLAGSVDQNDITEHLLRAAEEIKSDGGVWADSKHTSSSRKVGDEVMESGGRPTDKRQASAQGLNEPDDVLHLMLERVEHLEKQVSTLRVNGTQEAVSRDDEEYLAGFAESGASGVGEDDDELGEER